MNLTVEAAMPTSFPSVLGLNPIGDPPPKKGHSNEPLAQHIALSELPDPTHAAQTNSLPLLSKEALLSPLHQVRTTLQVCVGTAMLTVGELLGAQAQQVLQLDRNVDQPVDLLLEGQVVARGQLVAVGDRFGVRLTELPQPLSLDPTAKP